ncbi:hypothetical protein FVEN_g8220 [Fusarium venenatum]|nr:hypothetical protein FVEN_g8220 [Fusarium venenatum]
MRVKRQRETLEPDIYLTLRTKRAIKDSPKEIFNWYLLACTCIWSFSGVAKGFDEGNIASLVIMEVFKEHFGIENQADHEYANTKG